MKLRHVPVAAITVLLALSLLGAHDVYHVAGTITKLTDSEVSILDKDHKTLRIAVENFTAVWRDKPGQPGYRTKVTHSELHVGLAVEINASGDDEEHLAAQAITILVPAKPGKK